jgi:hypothetical protein
MPEPPIVVNVGRRTTKALRQLARNEGPLVAEVNEVVERVRGELGEELAGKTLVPLVIVYRRKSRRRAPPAPPFTP